MEGGRSMRSIRARVVQMKPPARSTRLSPKRNQWAPSNGYLVARLGAHLFRTVSQPPPPLPPPPPPPPPLLLLLRLSQHNARPPCLPPLTQEALEHDGGDGEGEEKTREKKERKKRNRNGKKKGCPAVCCRVPFLRGDNGHRKIGETTNKKNNRPFFPSLPLRGKKAQKEKKNAGRCCFYFFFLYDTRCDDKNNLLPKISLANIDELGDKILLEGASGKKCKQKHKRKLIN